MVGAHPGRLSDPSDEDLVAALRRGDSECLGLLVARWEQPLHRFVHRLLPRREDAQDVCQETFLRVLKRADRFQTGSRFSTWLYQIALNLCRDHLRRKRRWRLLVDDQGEFDESLPHVVRMENDPSTALDRREIGAFVGRALAELPAPQREVLILKEYEGLKFREIAEILGCPESTVKSRLYGGLNGMRAVLGRQGLVAPGADANAARGD